jgi:flagellar motility protein MotE (MotC chaperone)
MTRVKQSRRTPKRQVLPVIAGLLLASGLVRIGNEAGAVLAEENVEAALDQERGLTCGMTDAPEAMLVAFQDREARLIEREAQLEDRIQALRVVETEVSEKLAALEGAETSLRATMELAQTAAQDDLTRLTAVYENMKPANAAALFTEMDPAFAAGFLGLMRPESAAAVMSNLSPTTAYSISLFLAGRNAEAPTE